MKKLSYVSIEDHVVASVCPAQDRGGNPVTGGGELGSLALTPPIRVSVLTIPVLKVINFFSWIFIIMY